MKPASGIWVVGEGRCGVGGFANLQSPTRTSLAKQQPSIRSHTHGILMGALDPAVGQEVIDAGGAPEQN